MDQDNPARAYGLAFVPKRKARRKEAPELVLRVETRDLPYLERFTTQAFTGLERAAEQYLGTHTTFFWPGSGQLALPVGDLESAIGYRGCGYLKQGEEAELHLPLRHDHVKETALTLTVLLEAVNGIPREERTSNRPQLLNITTDCKLIGQYAHPVYGYVFPATRRWLNELTASGVPSQVVAAMRETWKAVAPKDIRTYADECQATITSDGRFSLVCFGNACDVSIYPDFMWREEADAPCQFSCHNLDAPFQQLTLIAGLAEMMSIIESRD